ncbi:MAG: hypothetical protein KC535_05280 [Nanoarchaeota archaeon]|nr:hypothetical protein [Nanoarchaeota archaeon]
MKTKTNIKKILLGAFSIFSIGLIAFAGAAQAYQGDPTKQGPNYDAGVHDLIVDSFDQGDYDTWKDLMEQAGGQGRILEVVNEDNFDLFVQAHNAEMDGNHELAVSLRAELGLNNGMGPADGTGYRQGGQGQGMKGTQQGNQQMNAQANYVDADNDGTCDNSGSALGQMKGQGRGR